MIRHPPVSTSFISITIGILIAIGLFFVNVFGQSPSVLETSRDVFSFILAVAGFLTLAAGIVYTFFKKQKYENLERESDEWKGLAESREARIKDLGHIHSEVLTRKELELELKHQEIVRLQESNGALVSQSLQMKAILRELRLSGQWEGHEDRIHERR